jgi:signal transduction histidine kinase
MAKLIENMLDLARARLAGGIPLARASACLGEITERVVQEYQATYPGSVVERRIEGDDNGYWDGDRLAQVAANLLGNALQHGVAGHPVCIGIDGRSEQEVVMTIANRGVIPAALLPVIFDPFRGGARNRPQGRAGLGLFIAQQIVKAHGTITMTSDDQVQTMVTVRLPRR